MEQQPPTPAAAPLTIVADAADPKIAVEDGLEKARSSGWGAKWLMWIGLVLLIVTFVVFAVYYSGYLVETNEAPATSSSQVKKQKTIRQLVIAAFSLLIFLVISVGLVLLAVLGLRKVEQKNLFAPIKLDRYRKLSGVVYSLPAGGLVLNTTPNAAQNARRVLFFPGNTGNLELYKEALDKIAEYGYNVFALEYRGYGPAKMEDSFQPNAQTLVQDAMEAWNLMGTSDGIVAGFSIGGAILTQIYEKLVPSPAQIVFLNSFGDLKQLLEDKLGQDFGGTMAPLMATKWAIQAPKTYDGHILVVFTADDLTVPAKHGERLCQVFSKSKKLVCRELPRGGHKYSIFTYAMSWLPELLPPFLPDS